MRELGPSPELFDAFYGKSGAPLTLDEYRRRYILEMAQQKESIAALAARVDAGETVTLLCSKDCLIEQACHRSILRDLIEAARRSQPSAEPG